MTTKDEIEVVVGKGIHSALNACMHKEECCERAANNERLLNDIAELSDEIFLLREELEKAQAVVSAAKNLVNVKGRHHSEIAMNRLIKTVEESK